jgi:hypothetical protein
MDPDSYREVEALFCLDFLVTFSSKEKVTACPPACA